MYKLLSENNFIAIQDEQISSWQADNHGKAVQHSVLGRVKAKLKQSEKVYLVSKWETTTQMCSSCGYKQKLELSQRVYECPECGMKLDRDINAAVNILKNAKVEYTKRKSLLYSNMIEVPTEHREPSLCNAGSRRPLRLAVVHFL